MTKGLVYMYISNLIVSIANCLCVLTLNNITFVLFRNLVQHLLMLSQLTSLLINLTDQQYVFYTVELLLKGHPFGKALLLYGNFVVK